MRKLYLLALSVNITCFLGCNNSGLGKDGGNGHGSGTFYDINKPID